MIEYLLEPFANIADYVFKNQHEHYKDASGMVSHYIPEVDWNYYLQASAARQCVAITARNDGKPVGYSVFFISYDPNHKSIMEATNSGIFVERAYRGRVSLQLINKADQYLKEMGVHEINYLVKDDRIGKLLARYGYKNDHKLWSRHI